MFNLQINDICTLKELELLNLNNGNNDKSTNKIDLTNTTTIISKFNESKLLDPSSDNVKSAWMSMETIGIITSIVVIILLLLITIVIYKIRQKKQQKKQQERNQGVSHKSNPYW